MFTAIRLMYAGAAVELAAWITVVVTAGSVKSAMVHRAPAQWHAALVHLLAIEVIGPIAIGLWLWMAWANGRGHDGARLAFASFFALMTLSLLGWLAEGAVVYARAELIACAVLCLIQLAVVVLIFNKKSNPYYRPELARRAADRV